MTVAEVRATWKARPIFNFNLETPCMVAKLALWTYRHRRITNTVSFVCLFVAFVVLLAR